MTTPPAPAVPASPDPLARLGEIAAIYEDYKREVEEARLRVSCRLGRLGLTSLIAELGLAPVALFMPPAAQAEPSLPDAPPETPAVPAAAPPPAPAPPPVPPIPPTPTVRTNAPAERPAPKPAASASPVGDLGFGRCEKHNWVATSPAHDGKPRKCFKCGRESQAAKMRGRSITPKQKPPADEPVPFCERHNWKPETPRTKSGDIRQCPKCVWEKNGDRLKQMHLAKQAKQDPVDTAEHKQTPKTPAPTPPAVPASPALPPALPASTPSVLPKTEALPAAAPASAATEPEAYGIHDAEFVAGLSPFQRESLLPEVRAKGFADPAALQTGEFFVVWTNPPAGGNADPLSVMAYRLGTADDDLRDTDRLIERVFLRGRNWCVFHPLHGVMAIGRVQGMPFLAASRGGAN